ncbi:SDR family oxidoreductase [Streptomyces sp. CB01881]|uniref:SDR family oxidoreductase n=1 Tax=Streptomyces sp. CB01881 TaxID=2078691 RepID=UPI000CDC2381|nr:SDR family oxidoreductase [Streptomyces sp. CB01881]AUY52714.1 dehydrogenase [Streptomyces sp. CB01881]TYC70432.1 SDR family oxidoreductase [Streptomyces sp. CB01881]
MSAKSPNSPGSPVALVTGANKGIGFAVARELGLLGGTVYLGTRDAARGESAGRALRAEGIDARVLALDVTDDASVARAAGRLAGEVERLDVLVNNAGVAGPEVLPSETPVAEVRAAYETNVFGVVRVTNAVLPLLRRSPAGRIVNMSSVLGSLAHGAAKDDPTGVFPPGVFPALLAYNTSKAALNAVTVTYANELRDTAILVNAAEPGFVATDLNGHRGRLTARRGARIPVLLATLGDDGPTGTFRAEDGTPDGVELAW